MNDHTCTIDFANLVLTPQEEAELARDRAEMALQNESRAKYHMGEDALDARKSLRYLLDGLRSTSDEIVRDETEDDIETTLCDVHNLACAICELFEQRRRTAYNLPLLVVA